MNKFRLFIVLAVLSFYSEEHFTVTAQVPNELTYQTRSTARQAKWRKRLVAGSILLCGVALDQMGRKVVDFYREDDTWVQRVNHIQSFGDKLIYKFASAKTSYEKILKEEAVGGYREAVASAHHNEIRHNLILSDSDFNLRIRAYRELRNKLRSAYGDFNRPESSELLKKVFNASEQAKIKALLQKAVLDSSISTDDRMLFISDLNPRAPEPEVDGEDWRNLSIYWFLSGHQKEWRAVQSFIENAQSSGINLASLREEFLTDLKWNHSCYDFKLLVIRARGSKDWIQWLNLFLEKHPEIPRIQRDEIRGTIQVLESKERFQNKEEMSADQIPAPNVQP